MYKSWVTYSIAVYLGFLLAGALVDPRPSSDGAMQDAYLLDPRLVEYQPAPLPEPDVPHDQDEPAAARS